MTTWKHQGGYRYEFQHKGKRVGGSGYPTKREAEAAEAEQKKRIRKRRVNNVTFEALCNERLVELEARRTKQYLQENKSLIDKLLQLWGNKKEIERKDVKLFLNKESKRSNWVANRMLRFIRALFNFGIVEGLIDYNPTLGIRFYPVERTIKYIPPHEDITKILDASKPVDKDYLLVVAYSLGRIREINNLKWKDVREDFLILRTRKSRNSDIVERRIPLIKPLKEVLDRLPHEGEYVFMNNQTGTKYDYRRKLLRGLCRKAKIERFNYHALRHYGASRLAYEGVPLTDIQALLGHQRATTTDIYLQSLGFASQKESLSKLKF